MVDDMYVFVYWDVVETLCAYEAIKYYCILMFKLGTLHFNFLVCVCEIYEYDDFVVNIFSDLSNILKTL